MKILFATSEAVPFAKTGGLADVSGALPIHLAKLLQEPCVILPAYRDAFEAGLPIEETGVEFEIEIGSKRVPGKFLKTHLPGGISDDRPVTAYLVDQPLYYNRDGIYGDAGGEYKDNCERFVFFSRAVLEAVRLLNLSPDVIHCNDWTTGLIPALLKIEYASRPGYENIASLLTIHNIAYQGTFWHWDMLLTGLDWKYFNWNQMEFYGQLNLLKTGLVFADAISTVSPTYAEEIQSAPLGCGLEGVLAHRREALFGILNGVDYAEWNPATDKHLPHNYDEQTWESGKAACKRDLQQELGLTVRDDVPLVGFVGRLAEQKGIGLIAEVMEQWLAQNEVQWVILGTGDRDYENLLQRLAERFPGKLATVLKFSNVLAHRIEAAADLFLMPSRYEPCGLTQMYSLKYGTIPLVHRTGGLADTITNCTDETLTAGTANGFSFDEFNAESFGEALRRACVAWDNKPLWRRLVQIGLRQDWSWAASADKYVELYAKTMELQAK